MNRPLKIAREILLQSFAFGGLALFALAAVKLSSGGFDDDGISQISPDEGAESYKTADNESGSDSRPLVILDPGHGGKDGGTIAGGALEKALNLDTAQRVGRLLAAGGVRVIYTRDADSTIEVNDRARFANKKPAALFVSIHHNASTSKVPNGVETYYSYPKPSSVRKAQRSLFGAKGSEAFIDRRGEELARRVQLAICGKTNAGDRGIKNHPFAVTRWVSAPAILVECGFLSNPDEFKKLQSDSYRDKLSKGIAEGVLNFLGTLGTEPLLGVSFPDRVSTSELAEITSDAALP